MGKTHNFVRDCEPDAPPDDARTDSTDANLRAARARSGSPFLNNAQAAFYVGLHWRTLENMRARGEGPRWRKHGRYVRYHIDDLDDWSRTNGQKNRRPSAALSESAPESASESAPDATPGKGGAHA